MEMSKAVSSTPLLFPPKPTYGHSPATNNPNPNNMKNNEDMQSAEENSTPKQTTVEYWKNPYLPIELALCSIFFLVSKSIPKYIGIELNERKIPYQVLNNGNDVVLNLDLNNDYVAPEDQTIPGWLLHTTTVLVPLMFLPLVACCSSSKYDIHSILCVYFVGFGLTEIITDSIKRYVGRFRPNFYQMCEFSVNTLECEADADWIAEGRKSFPSGHSSASFCAYTIITLFILSKVFVLDFKRTYVKKGVMILAASPMAYAFFVASSRVHDDWHHPADIVAGSLIGFLCATFSYSLWYPGIFSTHASIPLLHVQSITENGE